MDKISLIIPFHNNADTLERCIESALSQTYRNLEILLINDGSTDYSFDICTQLAQYDKRIRLINQTNTERSIARNHGMELATGEFISFLDADDFLDPDYFSHLHEQAERFNSDIAICDYKFFDTKTPDRLAVTHSPAKDQAAGVYKTRDWLTKYGEFYGTIGIPVIVPWAKIIRRSCAKNVRFPNDRLVGEDIKTMWKFYLNANRISFQT